MCKTDKWKDLLERSVPLAGALICLGLVLGIPFVLWPYGQ